jgi:hypothetical protein
MISPTMTKVRKARPPTMIMNEKNKATMTIALRPRTTSRLAKS